MNILITGNLSSLAATLAKEFSKEKNKIILACKNAENMKIDLDNVIVHSINPADSIFQEVLYSYKFDVAIYISTREEQLLDNFSINTGQLLDGLRNTLNLCKNEDLKRFFYISSTEVYGNMKDSSEDVEPHPTTINGHTLLAGEQYCNFFHEKYGLNTTIIRLPYIYGPDEKDTLLYDLIQTCKNKKVVLLPASKDTLCSFLHAEDVSDFIQRALDEPYSPEYQVINLSSSDQVTFSELTQLLESHFPKIKFIFDEQNIMHTRPVVVSKAKKNFDWISEHKLSNELPLIVDLIRNEPEQKKTSFDKVKSTLTKNRGILKWVELILGATLMQFLNDLTSTLIQFKYVDFRLLFVVLMGSLHGIRFGLLASVLASGSIIYSWYKSGLDWALLMYNVENWLPIAMYITAGAITGYIRDKKENEIKFQNNQVHLVHEKYSFLYGVYDEIAKIKDQFREQLLGYRDSFGRIFNITQELDTFHEDDVFLRALGILEDVMANDNIALYTLDPNSKFARLSVNSRPLNNKIPKSWKLTDFPAVQDSIKQRLIFQNTSILPNYPAYVSPIFNNGTPIALVAIWDAKFEQYSMYYYNLFKVICGLVQSSLVRAAMFMNANIERTYLPSTKILKPDAFKETIKVKKQMKKDKIADFQLLAIKRGRKKWQDFYTLIKKGIRTTDYVGTLDDGKCYVLLSQADGNNVKYIIERFSKLGIKSDLIEEKEFSYV